MTQHMLQLCKIRRVSDAEKEPRDGRGGANYDGHHSELRSPCGSCPDPSQHWLRGGEGGRGERGEGRRWWGGAKKEGRKGKSDTWSTLVGLSNVWTVKTQSQTSPVGGGKWATSNKQPTAGSCVFDRRGSVTLSGCLCSALRTETKKKKKKEKERINSLMWP